MLLSSSFYARSAREVAPELLGCFLIRKINGRIIKTKIVETEAYCGPNDLASHASRGRTERNKVMFGPAGIIYVYFTYGMHYMFNIVTGPTNYPDAVLIRAVEPLNKILKTNGPARLTKVLAIDKKFNGLAIYNKKNNLWIEKAETKIKPARIIKAARIGIDYAGKYKNKKWRFYVKDNKYVSAK